MKHTRRSTRRVAKVGPYDNTTAPTNPPLPTADQPRTLPPPPPPPGSPPPEPLYNLLSEPASPTDFNDIPISRCSTPSTDTENWLLSDLYSLDEDIKRQKNKNK